MWGTSAPLLALLLSPGLVAGLAPHGWDCISCANNSMLAGNWAINNPNFNNTDTWWAETIVSSYAALAINMNNADPSLTVAQARLLKQLNPDFKFLVYQNAELGPLTQNATATINQHPEWWVRNDAGEPQGTKQGYFLNHSRADVREWYNNYPLQVFGDEAKTLLDGVFSDGMGYNPQRFQGVNLARQDQWFAGKMQMADEASEIFGALNGGEVWGNGAVGVNARYHNFTYQGQLVDYNTTLAHMQTGFLEGAGSFWYEDPQTGEWIPDFFQVFLQGVINASSAGKTVVLHFSPGPSFPPMVNLPVNADPPYNKFIAVSWPEPWHLPSTTEGVRQAAADVLVQALAPFLIVVNENVFLQYAWFYEMQDGNIPCREGIECGMPSSWYPEFAKPLGPPKGPAMNDGYVWTREFEHASVYVDARSRNASRITWM